MLLTTASDRPVLTLAELEAFDPRAPAGTGERDFCCPLCGTGKRVDAAHRSLSLHVPTGRWMCHRCHAGGVVREQWQSRRERQQAVLRRAFAFAPTPAPASPADQPAVPAAWRRSWEAALPLAGTRGAAYLTGRGIPLDLAERAGARFTADCYGRPAVLFPLVDRAGAVVAFNGRHTDGRDDPKAHSGGAKKAGLFTTPGALQAARLVLTEAPLDALTLASVSVPAVALAGTTGPDWLLSHSVFRTVALAFDADAAGEQAAAALAPRLESLGAKVERWRPVAKDWNEWLHRDRAALLTSLTGFTAPTPASAACAAGSHQDAQEGPSPRVSGDSPLPADVTDPRPDLADDSAAWTALLHLVRGWIDAHPDRLDGALHGMRCGGLRLRRDGARYTLAPTIGPDGWESIDAWERDRAAYLLPHRELLTSTLAALPFALHGRRVYPRC